MIVQKQSNKILKFNSTNYKYKLYFIKINKKNNNGNRLM